jgi:hypothetical protein
MGAPSKEDGRRAGSRSGVQGHPSPPWELRPSLERLKTRYATMVDATTGHQLFTDDTHKLWDRMLQEVDDWWLSGKSRLSQRS